MLNTPETPAQRALSASTVALALGLAGVAMFLPPLVEHTVASPLRTVATAAVLAVALLLHWVFLGIAAQRMERSVARWTGLSLLLFPIGSVAALVLMNWLAAEEDAVPAASAAH